MGRYSDEHRYDILMEIGHDAQERYKDIIDINHYGYNLEIIKDGLQFKPNVKKFENEYWIDNGSEELNLIANYFEYGTGIHNTENANSDYIRPTQKKAMKFIAKRGALIFSKRVKGVRPLFMFERTMSEMKNNEETLKKRYHIEL